jgi:hypothetical protein
MQEELRSNLGNRTDLSSTRLQRFLNFAQVRLCRQHRDGWEELEKVSQKDMDYSGVPADDKYQTLPTNIRKMYSIRILDGYSSKKLKWVYPRRWDQTIPMPDNNAPGRPSHYTKYKERIELWKVPDQAYTMELRHSNWPTTLSADTQTSDFDNKDDILILLATVIAWTSLGKEDRAMAFWKVYAHSVNLAIGEDIVRPDGLMLPGPAADVGASGEYWTDPFQSAMP